ncbi:MAG: EAL domain-containing protein [Steroidobacteraceae bacterium]
MQKLLRHLRTSIGQRMAEVISLAACAPLLVLFGLISWQRSVDESGRMQSELGARSEAAVSGLQSRLAAARDVSAVLVAGASGRDDRVLRANVIVSPAFSSVTVVPADHNGTVARTLMRSGAGEDVLRNVDTAALVTAQFDSDTSIFVVRRIGPAAEARLAIFELDRHWLLGSDPDQAPTFGLVLVAGAGALLTPPGFPRDAVLPTGVSAQFDPAAFETSAERFGWQAGGREWLGHSALLQLPSGLVAPQSLTVLTMQANTPGALLTARGVLITLAAVLSLLLAVGAAVIYLTGLYVAPLAALQTALDRLGRHQQARLEPRRADEISDAVDAYNRAATRIEGEFRSLETLAEVDRMLLAADDVEAIVDGLLERLLRTTGAASSCIVLLDPNTRSYGRNYFLTAQRAAAEMSRVPIDAELLPMVENSPQGLTIARCEEPRHSVIAPLREAGSEYFWMWPVNVEGDLRALLAVGFQDAPSVVPDTARQVEEFAGRLAAALSKQARDAVLYRQAHYDGMTGLPNRLLLADRLEQEVAAVAGGSARSALLFVDLDHFKKINDSLGHAAGDQVLAIAAQRLRGCVKDGDTVARIGGDEFTIILRQIADPQAAQVVAERIVHSLHKPVSIGGRDYRIGASIGVTMLPDDATSAEDAMRNADLAMYRAKDSGRGRAVFFEPRMRDLKITATTSGLHRALERREFALYYQPQFASSNGAIVAVEALLRWQASRGRPRDPKEFVPAAEQSGLIIDIGAWVLETACEQYAEWRAQEIAPARLAVNISAKQLDSPQFFGLTESILQRFSIEPSCVEFELTESVLAASAAGDALERLAKLGIRIALDDFGTGYSAMNYLRQHPIAVVKIDRSFVEDLPADGASATLTDTIITMAHALGKEVVAEGVETAEQLEFLRQHGCDFIQGHLLSRPLPARKISTLLAQRPSVQESLPYTATG